MSPKIFTEKYSASFVYLCRMRTVLTTLNAKYIHTSLAIRWLYVANKDRFDLLFKEYTIKDDTGRIADELLSFHCEVIAISVSIWNVSQTGELIGLLKQKRPELIIIIGGPEVMYEPEFFLDQWPVDYVISGEGEFVLGELLEAVESGEPFEIAGVSCRGRIDRTIVRADLHRLAKLPSPYDLPEDREDRQHKLVYFETSRGCPYQCRYCLSSLEKGVRYFPQEYIFENLSRLIAGDVRQIKFLDRTFNLNKIHTSAVFDFLIRQYREDLVCQFEVYADLLDDAAIDFLNRNVPAGYFRFEIGIQSTYEPTNRAVKRKQDFDVLAGNIRKLMAGGKVDLHLDLIAGLPLESRDRFRQSFNDVFRLGAKEVQLGFLKMLRGTSLRREADRYGYVFEGVAPYQIICNDVLSREDVERIQRAEHLLDKYWNSGRFRLTMERIFRDYYRERYFEFFDEFAGFYRQHEFPVRGYQLEDLFGFLYRFLSHRNIDLLDTLRTDYYANYTRRPKGFWEDTLGKKRRKQLLYLIGNDKFFLATHGLTRQVVEKQTAIDPLSDGDFLLTVFLQEDGKYFKKTLTYRIG